MYERMHRKKFIFNCIPKANEELNNIKQRAATVLLEILPATIGLSAFSGWLVSFSLSIKSLIMYINQDEKAKLIIPINDLNNNIVFIFAVSLHQ